MDTKKVCAADEPGKPKRTLTPVQAIVVGLFVITVIGMSVQATVTYGSDSRPSEHLFSNSQTIHILRV